MPINQNQYNQVFLQCDKIWDGIFKNNAGNITYVPDGTIYVELINGNGTFTPYQISETCCRILRETLLTNSNNYPIPDNVNPNDIFFDLDEQKCKWGLRVESPCSNNTPIKIVLNPVGNDGSIFTLTEDESCNLEIKFNYLFKIKCETLKNIITSTNSSLISKNNENLVNNRQNKFELESKLLEINNKLETISKQAAATHYSIVCDNFPIIKEEDKSTPVNISPTQKLPFSNTGFGSLVNDITTLNTKPEPLYEKKVVNFCLTEAGLNTWRLILGENNYREFINGDLNSYTCLNVIEIDKLNKEAILNRQDKLIFECTTPFGYKTALLNELSELILEQEKILFQIDEINNKINSSRQEINPCSTLAGQFENISATVTLDMIDTNGIVTENVFISELFSTTNNLYSYLNSTQDNSGFFVCGEPTSNETSITNCSGLVYPEFTLGKIIEDSEDLNVSICDIVKDILYNELFNLSGLPTEEDFNNSLSPNVLNSNWLTYNQIITITSGFTNNQLKLNVIINNSCQNFCLLIDQISMNKVCNDVNRTNLFISESPGFEITKIVDNKKSWLIDETNTEREFYIGYNDETKVKTRKTQYNFDDERLILNSKEIDLTMNMALAVENDVWCYLLNNPNLLSGVTNSNPCSQFCGDNNINLSALTSSQIKDITLSDSFDEILISQLIDVKNRKTISSYPTLRAIYDRYTNTSVYGLPISNNFDYYKMEKFTGLINSYWNDLIEQVVPATTIWGSVKVYTNTLFDQQKFKYKTYTSLFGENNFKNIEVPSPINSISGQCSNVEVITTLLPLRRGGRNNYDSICIAQMNYGSEFIGNVQIINENDPFFSS